MLWRIDDAADAALSGSPHAPLSVRFLITLATASQPCGPSLADSPSELTIAWRASLSPPLSTRSAAVSQTARLRRSAHCVHSLMAA
jgi:hypothetical protein